MKPSSFIACCTAALFAAGCASAPGPLGGEPGGPSLAINQTPASVAATAPLAQVVTLPRHGEAVPAASLGTSTAAGTPRIDEAAAAEARAALAAEMAQTEAAPAGTADDGEQSVEEQLRLRALINSGEHREGQPLPEDN